MTVRYKNIKQKNWLRIGTGQLSLLTVGDMGASCQQDTPSSTENDTEVGNQRVGGIICQL